MSIGEKLRTARETKCLTTKDLSDATHVDENIIKDLENDDFHAITASIYGQGFIRLCANRLDLDPAPLLEEFKRNYNAGMVTPAEKLVGNYREQEALYKERSVDSRLFEPGARQLPDADAEPRPMPQAPEVPIQVTVSLDEAPKPAPAPAVPASAAPSPTPAVSASLQVSAVPPVAPAPAPASAPAPAPIVEKTVVVDAAPSSDTASAFQELFGSRGQTPPPPPEPAITPYAEAMLHPAAPEPEKPAPVSDLEADENSLFAQAGRKPKPVPVDPEDFLPRQMTGIFVPPSSRKEAEQVAAAPAAAPEQPPAPEPAPAKPEPVKVHTEKASPIGPSAGKRFADACGNAGRIVAHGLGIGLLATGKGLLVVLRYIGSGLGFVLAAAGRALAALGRFLLRNIRSVVLVGAAVLVALLGVWAVLGIRDTIRSSQKPHIATVQKPVAEENPLVELALPPPVLYAD